MTDQDNAPADSTSSGDKASQPFGTFGSARGSGLARGKRATTPPPTPAPSGGEYKPTAVEVVVARHEYKNPFEAQRSAESSAGASAKENLPPAAAPSEPVARPPETRAVFVPPPPPPAAPVQAEAAAEPEAEVKSELNILPPAENRRVPLHWENRGADKAPAQAYPPRPPREDHRERRPDERRPDFRPDYRGRESRPPRIEPAPQPKRGFLAWLKGLFGGAKAPEATPAVEQGNRHESHGDHQGGHRRRHRGGRGRYRDDRGGQGGRGPSSGSGEYRSSPGGEQRRDERPNDERPGEGRSGDHQGGHRRRHRGGRGRRRDDRGGPRPEGQQGGGFI